MAVAVFLLLCSLAGVIALDEVLLEPDRPYMKVNIFDQVILKCCYSRSEDFSWIIRNLSDSKFHYVSDHVKTSNITFDGKFCGTLTFNSVQPNDSGLYQCLLKESKVFTHGTYLHIYKPMKKTINLRESTKNTILTVEGVLLLLCVLVPSVTLLAKSNRLNQLEIRKTKKEEENIYQGLNLDECFSTYDQIERSQAQGPYQDVCNIVEEEEEIQLEKP